MPQMTLDEKLAISNQALDLWEAGDKEGYRNLMKKLPIPPFLAKVLKEKVGADIIKREFDEILSKYRQSPLITKTTNRRLMRRCILSKNLVKTTAIYKCILSKIGYSVHSCTYLIWG